MINFPSNPQLNQEYTFNNKTWKWNGSSWMGVLENYIVLSIDSSPEFISVGKKDTKIIPYSCQFVQWYVLSQESGDIQFDIKKSSINNYPNTISIIDTNYPKLENNNFNQSYVNTWNIIDRNDIIDFIVTSNNNIKNIKLGLIIRRIR